MERIGTKEQLLEDMMSDMVADQQELDGLNAQLDRLNENAKLLKLEIAEVQERLDNAKEIVKNVLSSGEEYHSQNMVFKKCERENVGYTDEKELLQYLKEHNYVKYITTKTTESLSKNPLKKDLKNLPELREELNAFILDGKTEYLVFTSEDSFAKMLEHIEEGKK